MVENLTPRLSEASLPSVRGAERFLPGEQVRRKENVVKVMEDKSTHPRIEEGVRQRLYLLTAHQLLEWEGVSRRS